MSISALDQVSPGSSPGEATPTAPTTKPAALRRASSSLGTRWVQISGSSSIERCTETGSVIDQIASHVADLVVRGHCTHGVSHVNRLAVPRESRHQPAVERDSFGDREAGTRCWSPRS